MDELFPKLDMTPTKSGTDAINSIMPSVTTSIPEIKTATPRDKKLEGVLENLENVRKIADSKSWQSMLASKEQKQDSFVSLIENSTTAGLIDYFNYDYPFTASPDDEFIRSYNKENIRALMSAYRLNETSFEPLKEAVSLEHAHSLAQLEVKRKDAEDLVQARLTESEQFWYTMGAELATDPTIYVGIGALAGASALSKAGRLSDIARKQIAGWSAGSQIGYGATVGAIDEDISMAEALLIYGAVSAIDYRLINKLPSDVNARIFSSTSHVKTVGEAADAVKFDDAIATSLEQEAVVRSYKPIKTSYNSNNPNDIASIDEIDKTVSPFTDSPITKPVWHTSTEARIPEFKKTENSKNSFAGDGEAFYFSTHPHDATTNVSGANKHPFFLNIKNPAPVKAEEGMIKGKNNHVVVEIEGRRINPEKLSDDDVLFLKEKGYDSIIIEKNKIDNLDPHTSVPDQVIVLDKKNILSAIEYNKQIGKSRIAANQTARDSFFKAQTKISQTNGFKKLQEVAEKIKTSFKLNDNELRLINETMSDVTKIAARIEMDILDVKASMKALGKAEPELAEDIVSVYRALNKNGYLSNSAMGQIEASLKIGKDGKFVPPKIEVVPNKSGKTAKMKINGKVVGVVGIAALGTSGLQASEIDGGDVLNTGMMGIGVMVAAGLLGVRLHTKYKSRAAQLQQDKAAGIVKEIKNADDTRSFRSAIGETVSKSRTTLTETVKPMKDAISDPAARKVVDDFYFDPLDAVGTDVGTIKRKLNDSHRLGMNGEILPHFKDWLKARSIGYVQEKIGLFKAVSYRQQFDKEMAEFIELGLHQTDESIKAAVDVSQKYFKSMFDKYVESGAKGANTIIKVDGYYLPRVVNKQGFRAKVINLKEGSYEKIIEAFAKTLIKTPNAREFAEQYLQHIVADTVKDSGRLTSKADVKKFRKELSAKGLDETQIDEIYEAISGQYGRSKARVTMDYSQFGKVEVEYTNGTKGFVTYEDLFQTDVMSAANTLFNAMSGHIALALKNYKSADSLIDELAQNRNIPENFKRTLINDIKATVGVPSIDYSQTFNIVAKAIANISIGSGMKLSTISLGSEGMILLANMVRTSGVFTSMSKLSNRLIDELGEDSFAMHSMTQGENGFAYGMHTYGASFGQFRTFDTAGNFESAIDGVSKGSEIYRDFTLHTLPFVRISDALERINFQDSLDALKAHFDGVSPYKPHELKAFAITQEMEDLLKPLLELNEKGHVKFFDYSGFGLKTEMEFKGLIDRIMMKRMNRETMGTTAAFSRHSGGGIALMPMLTYPMSAYSNIGAFLGRGALEGDAFALTQSMLWFQAGILQHYVRTGIQGRETNEVEALYAGLMNMPHSGLVGTAFGLTHAPTVKTLDSIFSPIDPYTHVKAYND